MLPATKANRAQTRQTRDTDTLVARFLIAPDPVHVPLPRSCPIQKPRHLHRTGATKDVRTRTPSSSMATTRRA